MMKTVKLYITSWARYNDGDEGKWIDVTDKDWDDVETELEKEGFDIKGYDEELTIHDYDDENGFNLYDLFGEEYPKAVVEFLYNISDYDDEQLKTLAGLIEVKDKDVVISTIDNGDIDNFMVVSDAYFDTFAEELIKSHNVSDYIRNYIDWDELDKDLKDEGDALDNGDYLMAN